MSEQAAESDVCVRPYQRDRDREALWELKRSFELGIGEDTGGDDKGAVYEGKLTGDYRERWLAWVDRCIEDDPGCVVVAEPENASASRSEGDGASETNGSDAGPIVGYAFVLPGSLSFVWDAAVLNELFVVPAGRGTGVADALMDAAIECARSQELPLDRMVLDVDRENERARAFYERHGFDHWGEMVAREL